MKRRVQRLPGSMSEEPASLIPTVILGGWADGCPAIMLCPASPFFSAKSAFPAASTACTLLTFHSDVLDPDLKGDAHLRDATFL